MGIRAEDTAEVTLIKITVSLAPLKLLLQATGPRRNAQPHISLSHKELIPTGSSNPWNKEGLKKRSTIIAPGLDKIPLGGGQQQLLSIDWVALTHAKEQGGVYPHRKQPKPCLQTAGDQGGITLPCFQPSNFPETTRGGGGRLSQTPSLRIQSSFSLAAAPTTHPPWGN